MNGGSSDKDGFADLAGLHDAACAKGLDYYIDPKTGLMTSTRINLEKNGKCCESACRHCPYGFSRRIE